MNDFQTISYDQATSILRRHANNVVGLVTTPFPGMSFQFTGQLYVQQTEDHFAFAVSAGENLSVSVVPFPQAMYQIPEGEGDVEALVCAIAGEEPGQEVMMWMVRFA